MAPEVIANEKYDYTCDIWSAGVIIFILLGGYPPFQAKDENDRDGLFAIIKKGKFRFHEKFWKNISAEAKDLITGMLTVKERKTNSNSCPQVYSSSCHRLQHCHCRHSHRS